MHPTLRPLALACLGALSLSSNSADAQLADAVFTPLPPCRVVDTRSNQGISGTGPLVPGQTRTAVFRGQCGIPGLTTNGGREANRALALALNVIAVSPTGFGHITSWPSNKAMPFASIINYSAGENIANGVIVPMCDQNTDAPCASGDISFQAAVSTVDLVVDVTGYYSKQEVRGSTVRFGAAGVDNFLCPNQAAGVRFGLSGRVSDYASAALVCPAGTWLCSREERADFICDTARFDSNCDALDCAGNCIDSPAGNHRGWTTGATIAISGETVNEGGVSSSQLACELRPSWCCSRND